MKMNESDTLWICRPKCNSKTKTKFHEDTVLLNFLLYCPSCKREFTVNVIKLKMRIAKEPDA